MESCPEELLLLIFSRIRDGRTLLDVGLVCKRWQRLSKDPRVWVDVDVEVSSHSMNRASASDWMHPLRVLLHAPALRRLTLSLPTHLEVRERELSLAAALRQSRAPIRELVTKDVLETGEVPAALYRHMWRNRRHLRSLSLGLPGDDVGFAVDEGGCRNGRTVSDAVCRMPLLEKLTIKVVPCRRLASFYAAYPDQPTPYRLPPPESQLPRLRYLAFRASVAGCTVRFTNLLVNLLEAGKKSLRTVHFAQYNELWLLPAVVDQLGLCVEVRNLVIGVAYIEVLRDMVHLRGLGLNTVTLSYDGGEVQPIVGTLSAVRALNLCSVCRTVEGESSLLLAVLRSCSSLTDFWLRLCNREATASFLTAILDCLLGMERLHSVQVPSRVGFPAEDVARLTAKGRLRQLSLSVTCGTQHPNHDEARCARIMADLKKPLQGRRALVKVECVGREAANTL